MSQEKYFMLTAEAENNEQIVTFANVYTDFQKLKSAYFSFKQKQEKKEIVIKELKTFVLMPVEKNEDLVIANANGKWYACLGPKQPLKEQILPNVTMVKVAANEIAVKE